MKFEIMIIQDDEPLGSKIFDSIEAARQEMNILFDSLDEKYKNIKKEDKK
jgi:hypothetical protein